MPECFLEKHPKNSGLTPPPPPPARYIFVRIEKLSPLVSLLTSRIGEHAHKPHQVYSRLFHIKRKTCGGYIMCFVYVKPPPPIGKISVKANMKKLPTN